MIKPTIFVPEQCPIQFISRFSENHRVNTVMLQIAGIIAYIGDDIVTAGVNESAKLALTNKDIAAFAERIVAYKNKKVVMDTVTFLTNIAFANRLTRALAAFYDGLDIDPTFSTNLRPDYEDITEFLAMVITNCPKPWEAVSEIQGGINNNLVIALNGLIQCVSEAVEDKSFGLLTGIQTDKTIHFYLLPVDDTVSKQIDKFKEIILEA